MNSHSTLFLKMLFARSKVYEKSFYSICKAGCDAEKLGNLLFAVCTIAFADQRYSLHPDDMSPVQLKRLTKDLRSLADLVDRVNRTAMNPKLDILSAPPDPNRDPIRKRVANLYDRLPSIMRVYSFHLERFSKFNKALLKRMTSVHFLTVRLLLYVEESTGSPRY